MRITGEMHFAKALAGLKQSGVDVQDVTPAELYALAEAARRCADPFSDVNADAAGFPVRVCEGVWFWKLTIGAGIWLDEVEGLLGGGTSPRYRLALIHALVHSREPEAFAGLDTERKVMHAVKATMRTIRATPEEVNRAMDAVLGLLADARPGSAETRAAAADWAALCARLETQTGIPATEWMWRRSGAYAIRAYNDLHAFAMAYTKGGGGRMLDELDGALTNLAKAKAAITKRVKAWRASSAEQPHGDPHHDGGGESGGEIDKVVAPAPARGLRSGEDHAAGQPSEKTIFVKHGGDDNTSVKKAQA